MGDGEITWHADPWVAARARHHDWLGEVWIDGDRGPESSTRCIMPIGAPQETQRGTTASLGAAKADAETAMRAKVAAEARGEPTEATHYLEDGRWHRKHDVHGGPHDEPEGSR